MAEEPTCYICDYLAQLLRTRPRYYFESLATVGEILKPHDGCTAHQKLISSLAHLESELSEEECSSDLTITKSNFTGAVAIGPFTGRHSLHDGSRIFNLLNVSLYAWNGEEGVAGLPGGQLPRPQSEPTAAVGFVGGRILHPEWIDSRLPPLWNDACSRLHDGVCKNSLSQFSSSFRPTWLVDVDRRCVVRAPEECSYVALSYVWGGVKTLLALKGNHERLRCPGSLAMDTWDPPVSKTALDAMGVVKLLGERYLWVDALCIVQDEEEKKQDELLKMSGIYAHATVTIIAAQGLSAESGLRGLQEISQPRDMRSSTHILGNGTTVIQFPVPYQREMSSESSVWGERAWTFQEQLFSRRRLVFDGDSVRWECSKAIWREHVDWTTILPTSKHNIDFPTLQSMLTAAVPNYNAFSAMLSDYNIRAFTYPEDALDAFSGTLAACSSAVGGDVISGLPTACFDAALLWSHDHSSDMRRRVARDPRKNHYLPSWSWAGWCGNLTLDAGLAQDFLKAAPRIWSGVDGLSYSASRVNLLVSWKWHETLGSDGVLIEPGLLQSRKKWLEGDVQSTGKWTRHSFCENTETKYPHYHPNSEQLDSFTHPEHPGFAFWYPVPLLGPRTHGSVIKAPYISCRTRRAWLIPAEKITVEEGPGWNDLPQISLRDSKGQWVGSLEPLVGIGRMREEYNGVALELAEIATGSYSNDFSGPLDYRLHEMRHKDRPKVGDWYEFYWVMWIEWENGIAYRRGLARVYKATWEMQPREEVDLILG